MTPEFQAFPKIGRLFRNVVITEKIDGTNAAVCVTDDVPYGYGDGEVVGPGIVVNTAHPMETSWDPVYVYAQSRKKVIEPGKSTDNAGFAGWVRDNARELAADLGTGVHFGEWWGHGIQRRYGLDEKRFSLFNTARWGDPEVRPACCHVVPIVNVHTMDTELVRASLEALKAEGSLAAPGFMNPEGVVVYHAQTNTMFKATIEGDDKGKVHGA